MKHIPRMSVALLRLLWTLQRNFKEPTDTRNVSRDENRSKPLPSSQIKCHHCGKLGHEKAKCRKKLAKRPLSWTTTSSSGQRQPVDDNMMVCYMCNTPGHIASHCTTTSATVINRRVDHFQSSIHQESNTGYKFDYDLGRQILLKGFQVYMSTIDFTSARDNNLNICTSTIEVR